MLICYYLNFHDVIHHHKTYFSEFNETTCESLYNLFRKNVENLLIAINDVKITKNTIFFKYQYSHEPDRYKLYFIVFLDLENIGLDTLFVHLRRLLFKLGTQIRSAIMAALNRAGDL